MGKIRVKTLGNEELEQEQKKEAQRKAQGKKERKETQKTRVPGLKGGQRVIAVGPSEEELEQLSVPGSQLSDSGQSVDQSTGKEKTDKRAAENRKQKTDNRKKRERSKKYKAVAALVDRTKTYLLADALETLPKLKLSKFDETVELHITTLEKGLSGTVTLPHGTGKKTRVAIADDKLIENIEKGKIEFDVLLANSQMMPKLAKVAKFLGPRGLMPNPKSGTITDKPEEVAKKYEGGQMTFKTESKSPIIHLSVGKLSFGPKKLEDNIQTLLSSLPQTKIKKITLKSTMSPGLKINISH